MRLLRRVSLHARLEVVVLWMAMPDTAMYEARATPKAMDPEIKARASLDRGSSGGRNGPGNSSFSPLSWDCQEVSVTRTTL